MLIHFTLARQNTKSTPAWPVPALDKLPQLRLNLQQLGAPLMAMASHGLPEGRSPQFFSVARHLVGKPDKGSGDDLQWFLLGRRLSTFCYCKIHQHHSICYSISSMLFPMSWWFILQPPQLWHSLPGSPKKIRQCEGIACQAASGGGYVQAIVTSDFLAMAFRQVSWMSSDVFYEHKLFGSSWWDSPLFNHPKTWCFCIL